MASVNKVILVGNLGADPETRYMPNGDAVTTVRLATTETWKDRNSGEKREATEWHRVVFFDRLAEIAGEYLKKGRAVYIEGRIEYGSYEKDGVKQYTTDIIADEMQMLGGGDAPRGGEGGGGGYQQRGGGGGYGGGGHRPQRSAPAQRRDPAPAKPANFDDVPFDDDIPF